MSSQNDNAVASTVEHKDQPSEPSILANLPYETRKRIKEDRGLFGRRPDITVSITKSDSEFLEQGFEFVTGAEGIDLNSLNDLYLRTHFPYRDLDKLERALQNSYYILWVRSTKPSPEQGKLLAFSRVISDGAIFATLWDICVLPAWQGIGLGRALIERLLVKLIADDIITITLYSERQVIPLYEKMGFKCNPNGIKGLGFATEDRIPSDEAL